MLTALQTLSVAKDSGKTLAELANDVTNLSLRVIEY